MAFGSARPKSSMEALYQARSGAGSSLYGKLLPILRAQGFQCALAGITLPNTASIALHEKLGFQRIGVYPNIGYKHGAWHDVGWWNLQLQEPSSYLESPSEPLTMTQLRTHSQNLDLTSLESL